MGPSGWVPRGREGRSWGHTPGTAPPICAVSLRRKCTSSPEPQFHCCWSFGQHVQLFVTPWTAHARLPCPSPSSGVCSNSCPLSRLCHPTISSSVVHFSSRLQTFIICKMREVTPTLTTSRVVMKLKWYTWSLSLGLNLHPSSSLLAFSLLPVTSGHLRFVD